MAIALAFSAPAAAQQQQPKTDLVIGKAGEFGHRGAMAMLFGDGAGSFTMNKVDFSAFEAHEVVAGDINNDGVDDVVVVASGGQVYVALGDFMDGLQSSDVVPVGKFTEGPGNCCDRTRVVQLGDLNNDGNLDIAVVMWTRLGVMLGNGDGTFQAEKQTNAGGDARGMVLGDFDGDGLLDLAADHAQGNWYIAVYRGKGDGTFHGGAVIPGSDYAIPNLAAADADGDGDLDIYSGSLGARYRLFTNNGAGSFTSSYIELGPGLQGRLLVVDDLNGDGRPDVVAGTEAGNFTTVRTWISNGSGGFTATDYAPVGAMMLHGTVADLNADGIKDLAMVAAPEGGLWTMIGNGDGTFQTPTRPIATYRNNYTIAAGRFAAPADTTPPTLSVSVSGTQGNDGWYTSDVTVTWTVDDPESAVTTTGCDTQTVTTDTDGVTFTCTAESAGGTNSGSVTIKRDATAPVITSATPNPSVLWPPNHKMVPVSVTVASSEGVCTIGNVTVNEGTNQHEPDIEVTGPLTLNLRAEREGKGQGRAYGIQVTCTDAAGNTSSTVTTVTVPHDQGKKK